jgi:hypothetical protein
LSMQNKFYLVAQLLHDFDVERLESVSVRVDEVEAAMHAVIHDVLPVKTALISKVPEQKKNYFKLNQFEQFKWTLAKMAF